MAWTTLNFSVGQILTAAQMTNLDNNFEAMAAGDSGAPNIESAALSTATVSLSGTALPNARTSLAMNAYAFFPMIHIEAGNNAFLTGHITDGASADSPRFAIENTDATVSINYDVDYRYMSP